MGCNCGKKAQSGAWVYVNATGVTQRFSTEIEARAAQIRAGGSGTVRPA